MQLNLFVAPCKLLDLIAQRRAILDESERRVAGYLV
jgi:hypothetical protein